MSDIANEDDDKIPQDFLCPITHKVMQDPVVTYDGHSYERAAIIEWFNRSNLSPLTGRELRDRSLISNYNLKSMIKKFSKGNILTQQVCIYSIDEDNADGWKRCSDTLNLS